MGSERKYDTWISKPNGRSREAQCVQWLMIHKALQIVSTNMLCYDLHRRESLVIHRHRLKMFSLKRLEKNKVFKFSLSFCPQ